MMEARIPPGQMVVIRVERRSPTERLLRPRKLPFVKKLHGGHRELRVGQIAINPQSLDRRSMRPDE